MDSRQTRFQLRNPRKDENSETPRGKRQPRVKYYFGKSVSLERATLYAQILELWVIYGSERRKDNEKDAENTQTTSIELLRWETGRMWEGGQYHEDLLIY